MAGREQRLHPALLTLTVHRSKPVGLQLGSSEHEREGKLHVGLRACDGTALQDDDTQQVAVGGALLVEEQVGLEDEPASMVDAVSLFLCRRTESGRTLRL